jgi:hypothetical protein
MSEEQVEKVRAALEAFRRGEVDIALKHAHPDMVSRRIDSTARSSMAATGCWR